MKLSGICVLMFLLFLLAATRSVGAETIVRYEFSSAERDAQLEDILYLSIGVSLSEAGLSSTRTADGAPYLLIVSYASRFSSADITLTLKAAGLRERILAETSFRLEMDFDLDVTISKAIDGLLEESGLLSADASADQGTTAIQGLLTAPIKREMSPDELLAATAVRYSASVGLGGMIVVGELTDYFTFGVSGVAGFSARKPWKAWSLSLGVRVLGMRLFNDDGVSGGPLYLSAIGLDVQGGTGYERPYRLSAVGSGGLAVLTVVDGGNLLHKGVPYVDLGVAYQLPVSPSLLAGLDVRYFVAFDDDRAMMGIVPALTIRKEF